MDFKTLHKQYSHLFNILEKPSIGWEYDNVYVMAFDAEWYQSGNRNVVLSYQIATVSREGSNNIIEFVPPGKRLKLAEIAEFGIRSVNNDSIPEDHATARNLVVLISHSTVAEWSVLADRDAPYITSHLTAIRKSPVTSGIFPIKVILGDYLCPCNVHLYDTRLIAPADYQSLKKLSTMLGSDDELKVNIGHHYIKRMDWLIKNDYPLYEKYALQDSEITLKLFFLLQSTLMELSGSGDRLFRTLASAAVKGYQLRAPCFEYYQAALKNGAYENHFAFIRSAYHGGRNEGFFVGRSDHYPETSERLWVDIDFVGCYPTAMALCPLIDCGIDPFQARFRGKMHDLFLELAKKHGADGVKYLPLRYRLPEMSARDLEEAGISKEHYDNAKRVLDKIIPNMTPEDQARGMKDFDHVLRGIKKKERDRLREKAIAYDNSLIDAWYERWKSDSDRNGSSGERFLIPGFAKVKFAFDLELVDGKEVQKKDGVTLYPCLPVSHPSYGLIYPLRGETVVTAPEIMLALDAGALIKALVTVELPVVPAPQGPVPIRLFFDHLADLTKQRNAQKNIIKGQAPGDRQSAIVMERLIKEFMNSFYGKTAQAINYKKMYDPESGLMVALGPSPISDACTAALATGLPRAALSAVLLAIDRFNRNRQISEQVIVASCTTDGLLVGLPRPDGVTAVDYYQAAVKREFEPVVAGVGGREIETRYLEMKKSIPTVNQILELCGCDDLPPLIESYLPIRQMRASRRELTTDDTGAHDDTFLEIKHFADQIAGIKTRGQIGWVQLDGEDIVTIQAKFGLKPPVTDIIRQNSERDCRDVIDEKKDMKELDDEYDRIMNAGGTVKATLECNWILEQIDRINSGETDVFEYTFYGLKGFNEIIKGGVEEDLTQTKGSRVFNADFDWKRKLVMKDGKVLPFTEPHLDIKEMVSYRGQGEKSHRWGEIATPKKVIQLKALAHSATRNTGGPAARLVRVFLTGMFHGHLPGKLKAADFKTKKNRLYNDTVQCLNRIWDTLGFKFETRQQSKKNDEESDAKPARNKQEWRDYDLKKLVKHDKWEECVNIPTERLEELLLHLCTEFGVNHETARAKLFAHEVRDEPDQGVLLYMAMAILKAPGQGIEPYARLYKNNKLPTREELIREFRPGLNETLLASREHAPFLKGQCPANDKQELVRLFKRAGLMQKDALACVTALLPDAPVTTEPRRNPGQAKCVRLFAQALRMPDIVANPLQPKVIIAKLESFKLNRQDLYRRKGSSFEYRSIKNTPENVRLIRKLARLFGLVPEPFIHNMLES